MFIIRTTDSKGTRLERTEDFIDAVIKLSSQDTAELYEKQDKQPAKQIGYTSKETEQ